MEEEADDPGNDINLIIVGDSSDGKSTLLNELLDKDWPQDERPEMLDRSKRGAQQAKGTTQVINHYRGRKVGSKRLQIYDTPGIGTEQCPLEAIMAKIREQFHHSSFQCILVTSPTTTENPGLGGQCVRLLLEEGFCGTSVWEDQASSEKA